MLTTLLMIWAYATLATFIWPMILLAVGVREPGMFAVVAPVFLPLLIILAPIALFFDAANIMRQHRMRSNFRGTAFC